jgi:CO dehydrogenase/acetyl-CoA synthase beta subunit
MKREGDCTSCGECCRILRFTSVLSNLITQHGSLEEARTYYSFRGFRITDINEKDDTACLEVDIVCNQLAPQNTCMLHDQPEKKPLICHRYPLEPDDIEGCGYTFKK